MGPGGAVTLNVLAIDKVFDWLRVHIDDRLDLTVQIQTIAHAAILAVGKRAERKRKEQSKKR